MALKFFVKFFNIKLNQNLFIRFRVVSCVRTDGRSDLNTFSARTRQKHTDVPVITSELQLRANAWQNVLDHIIM
jgi:hypothetical protein